MEKQLLGHLIDLKKDRTIKEKNILNKVIKYNLSLIANVEIIDLNTTKKIKRSGSRILQIY